MCCGGVFLMWWRVPCCFTFRACRQNYLFYQNLPRFLRTFTQLCNCAEKGLDKLHNGRYGAVRVRCKCDRGA